MAVQDFSLGDDLDLVVTSDGDWEISESDQNHILLILKAHLGNFKQFPLVGIGIDNYSASAGQEQLIKRNIKVQLENDGYSVDQIILRPSTTADGPVYSIVADRIRDLQDGN